MHHTSRSFTLLGLLTHLQVFHQLSRPRQSPPSWPARKNRIHTHMCVHTHTHSHPPPHTHRERERERERERDSATHAHHTTPVSRSPASPPLSSFLFLPSVDLRASGLIRGLFGLSGLAGCGRPSAALVGNARSTRSSCGGAEASTIPPNDPTECAPLLLLPGVGVGAGPFGAWAGA